MNNIQEYINWLSSAILEAETTSENFKNGEFHVSSLTSGAMATAYKIALQKAELVLLNKPTEAITEAAHSAKPIVSGALPPDFLPVLIDNQQAQIAGYYNVDTTDEQRKITNAVLNDVGSVTSDAGFTVPIGSKWDYDRSLDHAQSTIGLVVKNIQKGGLGTIVQFEQKMPYEWYGLGYFDGTTFKPHVI